MSRQSKWEYLTKIYHRYAQASSKAKRQILDEFCANCGYHRKYAIRLLNGPAPKASPPPACDLRASGDLGAGGHLASGGLSLVGPPESPAAGVDALGSETISLDASARTANAPRPA